MQLDDAVEIVQAAVRDVAPQPARLRYLAEGGPVLLATPRAAALRGAVGSIAHAIGSAELLDLAWTGEGPPALWFSGWHEVRAKAGERVEAGLTVLETCRACWSDLLPALTGLAVGRGRLRLLGIDWAGAGESFAWPAEGPADFPASSHGRDGVVVEARSPLQLRAGGQPVRSSPPLRVLVRSAGERLRQLHARWGTASLDVAGAVGALVRTAPEVVGEPVGAERVVRAGRRAGGGEQDQPIVGVVGAWRYPPAGPAATLLAVGAHLGVGKGTAFGCGQFELREESWTL